MAAPTPAFTDSFLVETDNYGVFLPIVRQNVIKYCSDKPGIDQPVLPPEEKTPKLWFHVLLRTKTTSSSLTLAIRLDDLYLVGFRTQSGVWWEFGEDGDTHLISKSARWLGFGGAYSDLIGHQKGLEAVTLGRAEMAAAVDAMAKHGAAEGMLVKPPPGDPYAVPKMMLAKLVIMVCEGLRFLTVSGTVAKEFNNPAATITKIQGKQVNKWDRISVAVFKWAKEPNATFPELEEVGVKDKNDAARVVALVKYQN